jgi:hypothetical protein
LQQAASVGSHPQGGRRLGRSGTATIGQTKERDIRQKWLNVSIAREVNDMAKPLMRSRDSGPLHYRRQWARDPS